MTITAKHVRDTLNAYLTLHPDEGRSLRLLVQALGAAGDTITSRKQFRGHVTASAILIRPDHRVLTVHHRALTRWLYPGGHVEATDETLLGAALRELCEECGVDPAQVEPLSNTPLHIDAHLIPANHDRAEPEHWHFDFRFLFGTNTAHSVSLQEQEVSDHAWQRVSLFAHEPLLSRILAAAPC